MTTKFKLYLDDVRTPIQDNWIVVRTFDEFVDKINEIGLSNFSLISLDHDLGESAMYEWANSLITQKIDYNKINEKTGYDAAKFLVNVSIESKISLPEIHVHSFNPVGSDNIVFYINNYLKECGLEETCCKLIIPHVLIKPYPQPKKSNENSDK